MKVAIHQPQYMPWLGYFHKMDAADVFVLLDDVQYKKNEWQNRNKIRNAEGSQWITVPVINDFGQKISEVRIDNSKSWREKHLKSIEMNYSRSPYFDKYFPLFQKEFAKDWDHLVNLNITFIQILKDKLGIVTELVKSSSLDIESTRTERLIDICRELKADEYIAGAGCRDYMDIPLFESSGVALEVQEYDHPVYEQVFDGFEPYMSVVDLLFCHGNDSLEMIRKGGK